MKIPKSHPRYLSLRYRHLLVGGFEKGYVASAGLIAHGGGECFDYLLGEKTVKEAYDAEKVATAMLLFAKKPVISVNGNTAALVPKEIVKLAKLLNAKLEINIFYRTRRRELIIKETLKKNGAEKVYGLGKKSRIPGLDSDRGRADPDGIITADVVLVSLEDGDRTEALVRMGKKVLSIDLNPISRTSQKATISIIDNIVRAIPNMIEIAEKLKHKPIRELDSMIKEFDNKKNLSRIIRTVRSGI